MSGSTYIRAPSLHFKIGGPLALGNVLQNPYKPTSILCKLEPMPTIETVTDDIHIWSHGGKSSFYAKAWLKVMQSFTVDAGLSKSGQNNEVYNLHSGLDTVYFNPGLLDGDAEELVNKVKKVKDVLDMLPPRPVYIITGLKIAKGNFAYQHQKGASAEVYADIGVDVIADLGVGAGLGHSSQAHDAVRVRVSDDRIVAYQVHVVKKKSWLNASIQAEEHIPKTNMRFHDLDDDQKEKTDDQVGMISASLDELRGRAGFYSIDLRDVVEDSLEDFSVIVSDVQQD